MNCHVLPISRVFFWTFKWFVATSRHVVKSYYCKIIMLFKYNFKRVLTSLCSEIDQLWFFGLFWHFLANFLSSLGESKNGFGDSCGDIRPDVRIRQWVWIWRRISTAPQKEVFFRFFFHFFLQIFANFCKFLMFLRYFSRFRYWGCLDNNLFIAASWWKGCAILYQKVSVNSYFSLITSGLKIRIMGIPTYEAKYKKVRSVYLEAKQNNLSWQTRG